MKHGASAHASNHTRHIGGGEWEIVGMCCGLNGGEYPSLAVASAHVSEHLVNDHRLRHR